MDNWIKTKLGKHTIKVGSGITPRGGSAVYKAEGIPFIRSQNVLENKLDNSDIVYITDDQHRKMASSKVKEGDVLLNITGASIGRSCIVDNSITEANVNQHVCIIRTKKDELNPKYLSQFLNSFYGYKIIYSFQAGGNRQGLNYQQIRSFPLLLPKIEEQNKIAQILLTWDEAIETVEELIEKKKKLKKGLLNETFSDLSTKKLVDVANIIMGQSPSSSSYNDLSDGLPFVGGNADIRENETKPRFFTNQITKIAKPDDIILTVRAPVGEIARNEIEVCIGRGVCSLRPKLATDSSYIYQALKHKQRKWKAFEQGSTFTAVNSNDIKKFPVPWLDDPNSRVDAAISLDQIDEEIELLVVKKKLLNKQKKGLMQRLLTGKVKVN